MTESAKCESRIPRDNYATQPALPAENQPQSSRASISVPCDLPEKSQKRNLEHGDAQSESCSKVMRSISSEIQEHGDARKETSSKVTRDVSSDAQELRCPGTREVDPILTKDSPLVNLESETLGDMLEKHGARALCKNANRDLTTDGTNERSGERHNCPDVLLNPTPDREVLIPERNELSATHSDSKSKSVELDSEEAISCLTSSSHLVQIPIEIRFLSGINEKLFSIPDAVIDTGSLRNIIHVDFAQLLKLPADTKKPLCRVKVANSEIVCPEFSTTISLYLNQREHGNFHFLALKNLPFRVILGLDFLTQSRAIIDCSDGVTTQIRIRDHVFRTPVITDPVTLTIPVFLCHPVEIPARSELCVPVYGRLKEGKPYLVESP